MVNIKLLSKICEIPGAPGYEHRIRSFILEQIRDYADDVRIDALGNIIAFRKGRESKKIMVAAHMDEISFIVTHIDDDGFVRFHPLGGFDPKTLTAQRVIIHGKEDIFGVMGTKPVHVMKEEEKKKNPEISEYFIDTGRSKEDLEKLISVGSPVTRERHLIEMGDCVNSKSLDNRISVYILVEALKELIDKKLPYDLYAVFTVQEEVGIRGAMTAASGIDPDFGIALDVTMAYDLPGAQAQEMVTKLGKGTAIKILDGSTLCDFRMIDFMKKQAVENEIPYQLEILPRGGTDTAGIQRFAKGGAIAGAISIPTRYLHQVIEMAHKSDIRGTVDLLKACLLELDQYEWAIEA